MPATFEPDSRLSWMRLLVAVALSAIGGVGMWSVVVALPAVQEEFGVARAGASLPYTLAMVGFAFGGVFAGRLSDRFGVIVPVIAGSLLLGLGYLAAGLSTSLTGFALAHGLLIGLGSSATFAPLIADISHWFVRHRGSAVAICAAGNYVAGTIWPGIVQASIATHGWRATHIGIGVACVVLMVPLAFLLRQRAPTICQTPAQAAASGAQSRLGLSPRALQGLLVVAGFGCCIAMAMPQVHIVAYCTDLGFGAARGAQMLSLMLGCGIVSRIASGWIADRIGGLSTLLLGSSLQGMALLLFLMFDGLASLYVISALFGLFQGGIVPSYALIVRDFFSPAEAGARVGLVIMATLFGMAFGGWMSGAIFDYTGSYAAAFVHGLCWNLLNVAIVGWLLMRAGGVGLNPRAA
ncbi:MFS transporter [Salinarimonas soli]|uniref:MFS transporter n=1 Tax=Salinarimonas soli TaxID=1638099 RepID=A0A5B2VAK2_9HYPH|nr:MFS transporter [Salinarimonas soli]KAA2235227.1 MFS transporter [Salinarimonas soli]